MFSRVFHLIMSLSLYWNALHLYNDLYRTESVVEKLLADWLSMSMYNHLRRSRTGNALFMLFQAIKRQTEKGPVDVLTGEARYCLTEDRLLREKIEPAVVVRAFNLSMRNIIFNYLKFSDSIYTQM